MHHAFIYIIDDPHTFLDLFTPISKKPFKRQYIETNITLIVQLIKKGFLRTVNSGLIKCSTALTCKRRKLRDKCVFRRTLNT
jgi:tyrosine-protein phosphatase YwqE